MVAIAANYLDNFFSNKSNAFIIAFLMMLASWSLAFTSIAHLGLAISSVCVLFLLFVLLKVTKGNQDSAANSTSTPSQDFSYSITAHPCPSSRHWLPHGLSPPANRRRSQWLTTLGQ